MNTNINNRIKTFLLFFKVNQKKKVTHAHLNNSAYNILQSAE